MFTTRYAVAGLSALALFAGLAPLPAHADGHGSPMDRTFLRTVSQANAAEIAAGNLALKKSQNPRIREVAQTIVQQHMSAENKLQNVAAKLGEAVPMSPDAEHQAIYRHLASLSGREFNREYLKVQLHDHFAAIKLFHKELIGGRNQDVRDFAHAVLPDIEGHTQMLKQLASGPDITRAAWSGYSPVHRSSMSMDTGRPVPAIGTVDNDALGHSFHPTARPNPIASPAADDSSGL